MAVLIAIQVSIVIFGADKIPCASYALKFSISFFFRRAEERAEISQIIFINEWDISGFNWNWLIRTHKTPHAPQFADE